MNVQGRSEIEGGESPPTAGALHVEAEVLQLLVHFFTAAMGLRLSARVSDYADVPKGLFDRRVPPGCDPPVWGAWTTDGGRLFARGAYDHAQSQRMQAHVLLIEWWLAPNVHHASWWRSRPRHPREWTAGRGG